MAGQGLIDLIMSLVFIVKLQITGKIPGDPPVGDILGNHLPVTGDSQLFINRQKSGQILPASGGRKDRTIHRSLHLAEILGPGRKVGQDGRMDLHPHRILLPYGEIRLHKDLLHPVQGRDIKLPDGFIKFRRISRRRDDPAVGDLMVPKGLIL